MWPARSFEGYRTKYRQPVCTVPYPRTRVDRAALRGDTNTGSCARPQYLCTCCVFHFSAIGVVRKGPGYILGGLLRSQLFVGFRLGATAGNRLPTCLGFNVGPRTVMCIPALKRTAEGSRNPPFTFRAPSNSGSHEPSSRHHRNGTWYPQQLGTCMVNQGTIG